MFYKLSLLTMFVQFLTQVSHIPQTSEYY